MQSIAKRILSTLCLILLSLSLTACQKIKQTIVLSCLMTGRSDCDRIFSSNNDKQIKYEDKRPVDENGVRYVIGEMGGKPFKVPGDIAQYVQYTDMPTIFDEENYKKYKPQPRSYQSPLLVFAFDIRRDGLIRRLGKESDKVYKAEHNLTANVWLHVAVHKLIFKDKPIEIDDIFNRYLFNRAFYPLADYEKMSEKKYGLVVYSMKSELVEKGIDNHSLYVDIDKKGNVQTYIECSNNDVPRPPCTHYMKLPKEWRFKNLRINVSYNRHQLPHWQKIESLVAETINSFVVNPPPKNPSEVLYYR